MTRIARTIAQVRGEVDRPSHDRECAARAVTHSATVHRPAGYANAAVELRTIFGPLRVVSAEGMIGFKLQALVNDPRRTQDREDIKALLRANRATLKLEEVREYFRLFDREPLFDEILQEIG